ncbi:MAG: uracil-DNA glycosylase family protein [Pseudomonadales bacterium]
MTIKKSRIPLKQLQNDVRECQICATHLPLGPRPVFQFGRSARILIAGQAPGKKVHESGVPFDDASGERLRSWMGVDAATFYNAKKVAILPMGFCYPGTGKSGDLPPRPECAEEWRQQLLDAMPKISLTLVIGQYAQVWHLREDNKRTLTDTVKAWRDYESHVLPLPHPSPRNNIWLKKNPWFEQDLLPQLKSRVSRALVPD